MSSEIRTELFGPPDVLQVVHTNILSQDVNTRLDHAIPATLKRRASSTFEDTEERSSRKKAREDEANYTDQHNAPEEGHIDGHALADELEQELQCGCCSALVYRPVIVSPCQHFFCGRSVFCVRSLESPAEYVLGVVVLSFGSGYVLHSSLHGPICFQITGPLASKTFRKALLPSERLSSSTLADSIFRAGGQIVRLAAVSLHPSRHLAPFKP